MSLPLLQVRRHGVIAGHDGDVLVCASVGSANEVVAVWTRPEGREAVTSTTVSAAGASFPDPGAARPVAARITVHTPEAAVTRIEDLTLAHTGAGLIPRSRSARTGSSVSPDLEPAWHYPKYTEVGPWDAISNCYALNVDDTSAWACYYSDFPVVRIRDGAVTGWHNDIKAPAPWRWRAPVSC